MNKFPFVVGLLFVVAVCSSVYGQDVAAPRPTPQRQVVTSPTSTTSTMSVPMPMLHAVDVDIKEQSDCPLHVTVDEAMKGRMPGTPLSIRTDGRGVVAAFVLRADFEPFGMNQMMFLGSKGLAPGEARPIPLPMANYREGTAKPVVSVDYVQFADGTSWGEDTLGRSKDIAAFLKGRNEALARLEEMLVGQDATDVHKTLDVFSSSSFSEPNILPTGRAPRYVDYYVRGYEEVINILRRMPRNSQLGIDLANKLEARTREQ